MQLLPRRVLSFVCALILLLSFLQTIPAAVATPPPPPLPNSGLLTGFRLRGAVPDGTLVEVSLAIPLRNLGTLSSLVKLVSDPSSALYRHFLTQQQVAQEFLPTDQFNAIMQSVANAGLKVQMTALNSMIVLQGTASQVRQFFGTDLNVYSNGTASYYMASSASFGGAFLYSSNATYLFVRPAVSDRPQQRANVTFTEGSFSAKLLQPVYNATGLYSQGYNGSGKTIGILDFFGSPTITSDLKLFDRQFGFPDPVFNILPIGPYAPNLGAYAGWSTEISLDVETSHAMAPGAAVDLYVANGALSLADALAKIVDDNKINTLSQSFTIPEWAYSFLGPSFFVSNALMPDQYYMIGSARGITFMGSTGDTGGAGFTSGVEGELGYPASSAYVSAVGGTQTYFSGKSTLQTAWSNIGYVPNGVNVGGGTGGVSILEPKPWYQSGEPKVSTLPDGRQNPDLSLQAGVNPATLIVDSGKVYGTGGTSESSPLLAGLVTLLDQSVGGSVGLINPFLYSVASSQSTNTKAFTQITFGYNIPWVSKAGYNLVTGLGSPNIGEMAHLLASVRSHPGLDINVSVSFGVDKSGLEQTPGRVVKVNARITDGGATVTTGSFGGNLVTLTSQTPVPLSFDAATGRWTGSITMGPQSGPAYMNVEGSTSGVTGTGFAPLFAGYFGTFFAPVPTDPWSTVGGLVVQVQSTTLDGKINANQKGEVNVESYSVLKNSYSNVYSAPLVSAYDYFVGRVGQAILNTSFASGPATLVVDGSTYGYLPFVNGIYLQTTYIYPEVAAEPGSVAPGQSLTLIARPVAPFNLYLFFSQETGNYYGQDLQVGANVTAELISPQGGVVSTASLVYQACKEALRACNNGASIINGYLPVPANAQSGLYTVLLTANYSSSTVPQTINGTFFGQVWVSGRPLTPSISVVPDPSGLGSQPNLAAQPVQLYQGQKAQVVARITYPNGTAVRFGEYTALVYPQALQDQYTSLMHSEYVNSELVQLGYSPSQQAWVGNLTLPSPLNSGVIAGIGNGPFYSAGPYGVFVTGISADGMTTTTALSAQSSFFIQPYVYIHGVSLSSLAQSSQLALQDVTITASGSLSGDLFLSQNVISGGNVVVSASQIKGALSIENANVTLVGVSGGDVTATNSQLVLKDSSVHSLTLSGSHVVLSDSSYQEISPQPLNISAAAPTAPMSAPFNVTISISGQSLDPHSIALTLDGTPINDSGIKTTISPVGATVTARLDPTALGDGVHTLLIGAAQSDGIHSGATSFFTTNAMQVSLSSQLKNAINALKNAISANQGLVSSFITYTYVVAGIALLGVVLAILAIARLSGRRGAT